MSVNCDCRGKCTHDGCCTKFLQIQVGIGEAVDRLTILAIKKQRLPVPKAARIKIEWHEIALRLSKVIGVPEDHPQYKALLRINTDLWEVEDKLRECLRTEKFWKLDQTNEFIRLAKLIPHLNDQRSQLKKQIDDEYHSKFREAKSYA